MSFFDESKISKKKSVRNKKPEPPPPPRKKVVPKTPSQKEIDTAVQNFKDAGML